MDKDISGYAVPSDSEMRNVTVSNASQIVYYLIYLFIGLFENIQTWQPRGWIAFKNYRAEENIIYTIFKITEKH